MSLAPLPFGHVFESPEAAMRRALDLAARGEGWVEPNPMVGAVIVDQNLGLLGEGWHQRFGGPHAEVHALLQAGEKARGATLFCTLEPCCHQGKTPPCTEAVIAAGIERVVMATGDPFPKVAGGGIARLVESGLQIEVGLLQAEARRLMAPYLTLVGRGRPHVHAKWAMTLDGRIASRTGASKWISNERSREVVHALRGRMDAVIVGIGTALADDPLLTARPPGPRVATRIVFDRQARLPLDSQLVRTAREFPVMVMAAPDVDAARAAELEAQGVEVARQSTLEEALVELGRREMTNVLVEGGGELLGNLFDSDFIDEIHVFMAPKLLGGETAISPLRGRGREAPSELPDFDSTAVQMLDGDVYVHARREPVG